MSEKVPTQSTELSGIPHVALAGHEGSGSGNPPLTYRQEMNMLNLGASGTPSYELTDEQQNNMLKLGAAEAVMDKSAVAPDAESTPAPALTKRLQARQELIDGAAEKPKKTVSEILAKYYPEKTSTDAKSPESASPSNEKVKNDRMRRMGRAAMLWSGYGEQAGYMVKEQFKSYIHGASAVGAAGISAASEKLAPKLNELAYRRGGENRWRRLSRGALKASSVGLSKLAPRAAETANKSLDKHALAATRSEGKRYDGTVARRANRYTNRREAEAKFRLNAA